MTRRRAAVVLAAVVPAALLAAACERADRGPAATSTTEATTTDSPVASDVCGEVELPPLQSGGHLLGDTAPPVPYSSVPPTSGWHASGAAHRGVRQEALTDPQLVLALEVGDVVAAYDPDRLDAAAVARLEDLATSTFADKLTVTPYPAQPTALSLLAWGVAQRCDNLDEPVLAGFVLAHAGANQAH